MSKAGDIGKCIPETPLHKHSVRLYIVYKGIHVIVTEE